MDSLPSCDPASASATLVFPIPPNSYFTQSQVRQAIDSSSQCRPGLDLTGVDSVDLYSLQSAVAVHFISPEFARRAFATAYNAVIPGTCPKLFLAFEFDAYPTSYPRSIPPGQPPVAVYDAFKAFGPIFRITNDTVWFWEESDALKAEQSPNSFLGAYHPRTLEINGWFASTHWQRKCAIQHLSLFGTVISYQFHANQLLTVEYASVESADMALAALRFQQLPFFNTVGLPLVVCYKPAVVSSVAAPLVNDLTAKIAELESQIVAKSERPADDSSEEIIRSMESMFLRSEEQREEQALEVLKLKEQLEAKRTDDQVKSILQTIQGMSQILLERSEPRPPAPPPKLEVATPEPKAKDGESSHTHLKLKILALNRELQKTKEELCKAYVSRAQGEVFLAASANEEREALLDQLREAVADRDRATETNGELTVSRDYFYNLVSQMEAERSSCDADRDELETLRTDVKNLKADLDEKSHSLVEALHEGDGYKRDIELLHISIESGMEQFVEQQETAELLRKEIATVEEQKLSLNAALEEKGSLIRELEEERDALVEDLSCLESKVQDQREEVHTMRGLVTNITSQCATKDEKLQEVETALADKEASVAVLTKEKNHLASQVEFETSMREELNLDIDELHRERKDLESDLKKERSERKAITKARNELAHKLAALEKAGHSNAASETARLTMKHDMTDLIRAAESRRSEAQKQASTPPTLARASGSRDSWILDREFEQDEVARPQLRLNTNELMARAHRRAAEQGQAERMRRRRKVPPPPRVLLDGHP